MNDLDLDNNLLIEINANNYELIDSLQESDINLSVIDSKVDTTNLLNGEFWITFLLSNVASIGISLFSSWLYDVLKNKANKLKIGGTTVEIDLQKIKIAVRESLSATIAEKTNEANTADEESSTVD